MINIETLKKIGNQIYKVYMGIGIFSVGLMATCVIYAVIMRYFFSISHTFLEEFMTTLFAFTTFWGIGICIVENEHVTIDSFYNMFPARLKKIISIINYIIVLIVDLIMVKFGLDYALRYGKQISFGMRVPMIWMYGIIPLGTIIAFVCIAIKLVILIKSPISHFEKNTDRFN